MADVGSVSGDDCRPATALLGWRDNSVVGVTGCVAGVGICEGVLACAVVFACCAVVRFRGVTGAAELDAVLGLVASRRSAVAAIEVDVSTCSEVRL